MQIGTWSAALLAMALLGGCSQEAPPDAQDGSMAANGAQLASTPAEETSDEGSDEGEPDTYPPTTEQGMYGYQYEIMPFPPPLGPNGESRTFQANSTAAFGFTGDVTFSALPLRENEVIHQIRMEGANGLSYDLAVVPNGGVDAISTIDWSKLMMTPVGMADYLKAQETSDIPLTTSELIEPGTLVFVFEVITIGKSGKPSDAPGCGNDRYIAITAPSDGSWDELPFTIATFSPGPWPPADSSRNCGVLGYTAAELSNEGLSGVIR